MNCSDIDELTEAYVIGALDARDTAAIDVHLAECAYCRARVESYRKTIDGLLVSPPEVEPPTGHRERFHAKLLTQIAAKPESLPRLRIFPRIAVFTRIAAAIFLLAVIGLAVLASSLSSDLTLTRAALSNAQVNQATAQATLARMRDEKTTAQATIDRLTHDKTEVLAQLDALQKTTATSAQFVTMLTQPGVTLAEIDGTSDAPTAIANIVMTANSKSGMVLARNWPALPPNKTYQLWYVPRMQGQLSIAGQAFTLVSTTGAGTATAIGSGAFLFEAPDTMAHYRGIGITIEPPGGSPRPTSPIYLLSDFRTPA